MFHQLLRAAGSPRLLLHTTRTLCSAAPLSPGEAQLATLLRVRFPAATELHVEDISGGCGAMFAVHVTAAEFAGMNRVKQHRAVQDALAAEIRDMHGIRVSTAVPKPGSSDSSGNSKS